MDMYATRQNKEKVSRRIDAADGTRQRVKVNGEKCNRETPIASKDIFTTNGRIIQRNVWDLPEDELKRHIGGEYRNGAHVGGHSKKVMKEFHKNNFTITTPGGGGGGIYSSDWFLNAHRETPKNSTFFPDNWSWDTIKRQIENASENAETRGHNHNLRPGIKKTKAGIYIKKAGDTIYPVRIVDAFT